MDKTISLKQLNRLFSGMRVAVTSTSSDGRNLRANKKDYGICKMFHKTESGVDIELKNESRYGLTPELLTENSVEGEVSCLIALRRRVDLV